MHIIDEQGQTHEIPGREYRCRILSSPELSAPGLIGLPG
jgi:hypothetical protein